MSASDNLGRQWEAHDIRADEVQVGDRTSVNGKTRVAKVQVHKGKVIWQERTTGSRSPAVGGGHEVDKVIRVWRRPS